MTRRHAATLTGSFLLVFGIVTVGVVVALQVNPLPETSIIGAVLTADSDPHKQSPVPDAQILATAGKTVVKTQSDASGFFRLTLPFAVRLGRPVQLQFRRDGYSDLEASTRSSNTLFIAHLIPAITAQTRANQTVGNVRIRYTMKMESFVEVGAVAKTFQVTNIGNVPCRRDALCSPNGDWKANSGHLVVDANVGNHFRNARVSCIAGPCPFTRIEIDDRQENQRLLHVSALDWSDTATFLVEADVIHTQISDMVRQAVPVVFGRTLSFTLPPTAAGPSIEAEVNGEGYVFPLGPELLLSWADCSEKTDADRSRLYSCELKPQYRFM